MRIFSEINNLEITFYKSPMFLESREDFNKYANEKNSLSHAGFYKNIRKKLNILIDKNQIPVGGKWSFDEENRKKIPKDLTIPKFQNVQKSSYHNAIIGIIEKYFSTVVSKFLMHKLWSISPVHVFRVAFETSLQITLSGKSVESSKAKLKSASPSKIEVFLE